MVLICSKMLMLHLCNTLTKLGAYILDVYHTFYVRQPLLMDGMELLYWFRISLSLAIFAFSTVS
jgi:hypothetical protein